MPPSEVATSLPRVRVRVSKHTMFWSPILYTHSKIIKRTGRLDTLNKTTNLKHITLTLIVNTTMRIDELWNTSLCLDENVTNHLLLENYPTHTQTYNTLLHFYSFNLVIHIFLTISIEPCLLYPTLMLIFLGTSKNHGHSATYFKPYRIHNELVNKHLWCYCKDKSHNSLAWMQ